MCFHDYLVKPIFILEIAIKIKRNEHPVGFQLSIASLFTSHVLLLRIPYEWSRVFTFRTGHNCSKNNFFQTFLSKLLGEYTSIVFPLILFFIFQNFLNPILSCRHPERNFVKILYHPFLVIKYVSMLLTKIYSFQNV